MPPRLILNADDFGLTPGINRAVAELHRAGALTSASLMGTGPAFEKAVEIARANPALGVGCHLVFVDGLPISHPESIPTLLGGDGKSFRESLPDFLQALFRGAIRGEDLMRETQAQIQHLQRAGIDVTHIDTHKHLHSFPAVLKPVLYIAGRCGIETLRKPFEPAWSAELADNGLWRGLQLKAQRQFARSFDRETEPEGTRGLVPEGTLGIAATGALNPATLRSMLERLCTQPEGSVWELCCHPGHVDRELDLMHTRLRHARAAEYRALLEVIPEFSSENHAQPRLELIHYGNLGVAGLQRAAGQFSPFTGYEKVL
jgi:predicted glycoside hydrolase/deacetylase ChbG (UPF0249 family)